VASDTHINVYGCKKVFPKENRIGEEPDLDSQFAMKVLSGG